MAVIIVTWDEPSNKANVAKARARAGEWRKTVLAQPGLEEFQVLRNFSSPTGMVIERFSSSSAAMDYLESDDYSNIVEEMKELGMTNVSGRLWPTDPDVPRPLTPP